MIVVMSELLQCFVQVLDVECQVLVEYDVYVLIWVIGVKLEVLCVFEGVLLVGEGEQLQELVECNWVNGVLLLCCCCEVNWVLCQFGCIEDVLVYDVKGQLYMVSIGWFFVVV